MKKIHIMLFIGIVSLFLISCAGFKPQGLVSKIDATTYSVTTYGGDAASAAAVATSDAKGICKKNHKTEYFKVISLEDENLSKNDKSGLAGVATAWIGGQKRNNKATLTFQCN